MSSDDGPTKFELENPKLRFVEQDPLESVAMSQKSVAERIISYLRLSSDGVLQIPSITSFCQATLNVLKICSLKGNQHFNKFAQELEIVSEALLAIVGGKPPGANSDEAVKELQKSARTGERNSLIAIVQAALTTSSHWQDFVGSVCLFAFPEYNFFVLVLVPLMIWARGHRTNLHFKLISDFQSS